MYLNPPLDDPDLKAMRCRLAVGVRADYDSIAA